MENGGDGSVAVEFLGEDGVEELKIEDVALIEGDAMLIRCDVFAFWQIVAD